MTKGYKCALPKKKKKNTCDASSHCSTSDSVDMLYSKTALLCLLILCNIKSPPRLSWQECACMFVLCITVLSLWWAGLSRVFPASRLTTAGISESSAAPRLHSDELENRTEIWRVQFLFYNYSIMFDGKYNMMHCRLALKSSQLKHNSYKVCDSS